MFSSVTFPRDLRDYPSGALKNALEKINEELRVYDSSLARATVWGLYGTTALALSCIAAAVAPIVIKSLSERAFSLITGNGFFWLIVAGILLNQQRKNLTQFHLSMPTFLKVVKVVHFTPYTPTADEQRQYDEVLNLVKPIRDLEKELNLKEKNLCLYPPFIWPRAPERTESWVSQPPIKMPFTEATASFADREKEIAELSTHLLKHNTTKSQIPRINRIALGLTVIQAVIFIAAKVFLLKEFLLAAMVIGAVNICLNIAVIKKLNPLSFKMPLLIKDQFEESVDPKSEKSFRKALHWRINSDMPRVEAYLADLKGQKAAKDAAALPPPLAPVEQTGL